MNVAFNKGTITNVLSPISQSEYSVIELKILENLTHKTLGIWLSASPSNPKAVADGGTALFRGQKVQRVQQYTKTNMYDNGNIVESEILAKISVSSFEKIKYEIESLDRAGIQAGTRDAFLGYIAQSVQISITSFMDALYIQQAMITTKKQYLGGNTNAVLVNPNWGDLRTEQSRTDAYRQIARAKVAIQRHLTRYNIGAKSEDFGSYLHDYITTDLLLTIAKNGGGNVATELAQNLVEGTRIVAGLGMVKDHLFLNKQILKGTSFALDKDFDFTGFFGLISHREALFIALYGFSLVTRINQAGNEEFITKFGIFQGEVRPELVVGLYTQAPKKIVKNQVQVQVQEIKYSNKKKKKKNDNT